MTKKDYIIIADAIAPLTKKDLIDTYTLQAVFDNLLEAFKADNPRFDAYKFIKRVNGLNN